MTTLGVSLGLDWPANNSTPLIPCQWVQFMSFQYVILFYFFPVFMMSVPSLSYSGAKPKLQTKLVNKTTAAKAVHKSEATKSSR